MIIISILGGGLFLISLFNISIFLKGDRDSVDRLISMHAKAALIYVVLVSSSLTITCIAKSLSVLNEKYTVFLWISYILLIVTLLYVNLSMILRLVKNGFKPGITGDFISVIFYLSVIILISDRFAMPEYIVVASLTLLTLAILYFMLKIISYIKIAGMFHQPFSLYKIALGARIFSILVGLDMIAIGYSENIHKGVTVLAYLVFTAILWMGIKELSEIEKTAKNYGAS